MKYFLNVLLLLMLLASTGCTGTSNKANNADSDSVSVNETKDADKTVVKKVKSVASTEKKVEPKTLSWAGASSRDDLRQKLDGTTWETVKPDGVSGLYYRFVIRGNNVTRYTCMPTRNYDDPKTWDNAEALEIYDVYEPKEGLFVVPLKGKKGIDEIAPTYLVFKGAWTFFSWGSDDQEGNTNIKLVSSN